MDLRDDLNRKLSQAPIEPEAKIKNLNISSESSAHGPFLEDAPKPSHKTASNISSRATSVTIAPKTKPIEAPPSFTKGFTHKHSQYPSSFSDGPSIMLKEPATKMDQPSAGYITLAQAAAGSPYSQEYISLRVRTGKLPGKKFGRNWYIRKEDLDEYIKQQALKANIKAEDLNQGLPSFKRQQETPLEFPRLTKQDLESTLAKQLAITALLFILLIAGTLKFFQQDNSVNISQIVEEVTGKLSQSTPAPTPAPPVISSPQVVRLKDEQIISALSSVITAGLPQEILVKLQGPAGPVGSEGPAGLPGPAGPPGSSGISYTAPTAAPGSAGSILGITYLGAKEITTEKLFASSDITQTGGTASLKSTSISGDLSVSGTATLGSLSIAGNNSPSADNSYDLGSASLRWRDLYLGPDSLNIYSTSGTTGTGNNYVLGTVGFSSDALTIQTANAGTATGGQINITSAYPSGNTSNSAFNFTTSTNLAAADELLQIGDSAATFLTVLGNGNIGIGIISPASKLHVLATTEQLRLSYDASNYLSVTVSSTGAITLNATGTSSALTLGDGGDLISINSSDWGISSTGAIINATYEGLTITTTTGTLTIANGKTLTVSNTLTFAGTDGTTFTFPGSSDTVVTLAATQTLTNKTLTSPTINGGTHTGITSLGIRSTGTGAFDLTIANTENLTAGRTLTITTGDAARTITLSGNPTLADWFDQSVKTTAAPQFARLGLGTAADSTNIFTATSASTADLSKTVNVAHTGAITGTGYAGYFSKTGASTTNVGLYATATGATNNYAAIFDAGNVGIGDSTPSSLLEVGNGTDSLQISSVGDMTFVDADGAASITGPAGGALTIAAGASQALTLTANNASTWSTSNGLLTITGDDGITLTATSTAGITGNVPDNIANAIDIQQGSDNYLNVNTTNSSENIAFGNATTNPTFSFLGTGAVTIAGSTDGTDALVLTLGDILVSNGDLDLSGGDFNVTLDASDTANITKTGANAGDVVAVAGTSANAIDVLDLSATSTADAAADSLNGLVINWTESTDADTFTALVFPIPPPPTLLRSGYLSGLAMILGLLWPEVG